MARGEVQQTKVQFNGKENDFVIFVDDANAVEEWKTDKSIPLVHVVKAFKIFVTQKHGAQGQLLGASNADLDNEFGTHDQEEVIKLVLEKGVLQEKRVCVPPPFLSNALPAHFNLKRENDMG